MKTIDKPRERVAFELVFKRFHQDEERTDEWFERYNPSLGAAPMTLMKKGQVERLIRWIRIQIEQDLIGNTQGH